MLIKQREEESKILIDIIKTFTLTKTGSTVYISGPPGCGKTFTALSILDCTFPQYIYVNCAFLKAKKDIYKSILAKLNTKNTKNAIETLKTKLKKGTYCIILDEIDFLITKKQDILYNLFDLPHCGISLLIICISNTMNLPEKIFESKVKSRFGNKRINFKAYTSEQLFSLIGNKNIDRNALNLLSKRIGAVSGDLRKLIAISNSCTSKKKLTATDIDKLYKEMFKPIYQSFLLNLNFYQKMIIFVLCKLERTKEDLFEDCLALCKVKDVNEFNFYEFKYLLKLLVEYKLVEKINKIYKVKLTQTEIFKCLENDKEFQLICK